MTLVILLCLPNAVFRVFFRFRRLHPQRNYSENIIHSHCNSVGTGLQPTLNSVQVVTKSGLFIQQRIEIFNPSVTCKAQFLLHHHKTIDQKSSCIETDPSIEHGFTPWLKRFHPQRKKPPKPFSDLGGDSAYDGLLEIAALTVIFQHMRKALSSA